MNTLQPLAFAQAGRQFVGRDKIRRDAIEREVAKYVKGNGTPKHDSVVIVGNGIGSLSFAARLAQSDTFQGRVTIIAPPIQATRRLINAFLFAGTRRIIWHMSLGSRMRS